MSAEAARDIEQLLSSSRRARADGAMDRCRSLLEQARARTGALDGDHPLRQVVAWRTSKACFDDGAPLDALDALIPILDDDDPFEHHPSGLNGAEPLARAVWDQHGYGQPAVVALWAAWSRAHQRRGDPFLAAMGDVQRAWQLACLGHLDDLEELVERYAVLGPRTFGDGPHRHPRAPDAPSSVFWVQMDLARTLLRAATWAAAERPARIALELYEDALAEAGAVRLREYWFVEPTARAALALGWSELGDVIDAWPRLAASLDHPRAPLHRALAAADEARARGRGTEAVHALVEAMRQARALQAGPEWEIDPRVMAARVARGAGVPEDTAWLDEARALIERASVHVFDEALRGLEAAQS